LYRTRSQGHDAGDDLEDPVAVLGEVLEAVGLPEEVEQQLRVGGRPTAGRGPYCPRFYLELRSGYVYEGLLSAAGRGRVRVIRRWAFGLGEGGDRSGARMRSARSHLRRRYRGGAVLRTRWMPATGPDAVRRPR